MNEIDTVYEAWEQLKNCSSTLKKVDILNSYVKNKDVRNFFFYALNDYNYGVKSVKNREAACKECVCSFTDMINLLESMRKREITGNKADEAVEFLLEKCDEKAKTVFLCMLQKKTRCGVSTKLVDKVWPNMITNQAKVMKARP